MQHLKRLDIPDLLFFSALLALVGLGLVMVYSASSMSALEHMGDSAYYLKRQSLFAIVGLVAMLLVSGSDYRRWVKAGPWIFVGAAVLLALVHVPGLGVRAGIAARWLSLGGYRFQPAEFAKIACVLYLACVLGRKSQQIGSSMRDLKKGFLPMVGAASLLVLLLLKQPDFGNAMVLVVLAGAMIFLSGARKLHLLGGLLAASPFIYWFMMGEAYRRKRILAFLNPWEDPQNLSYQIVQSFTAFYSGGVTGTGLGNGRSKLYYLPEVHTDFIFAVLGEELGFVGVSVTLICFAVLVWRGFRISVRARDAQGFMLAAGCSTLLGLQAAVHMCVVTGLLPTKGLPLPFISNGGSAMMASLIACGLILSVARQASLNGPAPSRPWLERWGA